MSYGIQKYYKFLNEIWFNVFLSKFSCHQSMSATTRKTKRIILVYLIKCKVKTARGDFYEKLLILIFFIFQLILPDLVFSDVL